MEDGVKLIFKTLLKVPVIIVVCYFVMNMFFFFFIYFKMLGISYVAMQTCVENNYIPNQERQALCNYLQTIHDIPFVGNRDGALGLAVHSYDDPQAVLILGVTGGDMNTHDRANLVYAYNREGDNLCQIRNPQTNDASHRTQYGGTRTVGVACNYHMLWPLTPAQTTANGQVTGFVRAGGGAGGGAGSMQGTAGSLGYDAAYEGLEAGGGNRGMNAQGDRNFDIVITYTVPGLHYYPDMINY